MEKLFDITNERQAAAKCGVPETSFRRIIRGSKNPTMKNLLGISKGLRIPIAKLVKLLAETQGK